MGEQIMVIQMARMGDVLQTIPLLSRLRAAYPTAGVGVLSDRVGQALLADCPAVDEVLTFNLAQLQGWLGRDGWGAFQPVSELVNNLRQKRYDLIFNINFSNLTLLLTYLLGASKVRGYQPTADGRGFGRETWLAYIYSLAHARRVNRINLADVFRHLAPPPAAVENDPQLLESAGPALPVAGEPLRIALQLGSRHPRRRWPVSHYATLANCLIQEYDAQLLLLGIKEEAPLGEILLTGLSPARRGRVINLQGRTSLSDLAEVLQQAHLLVTGDTGTMHLAASKGTPVLALFMGPAQCFETGPYGRGHYVLQAEPDCHPCSEAVSGCENAECRRMISPEMVARVISSRIFQNSSPDLEVSAFPGVQLYRSESDSLGISYQPQLARPWSLAALVGLAYREAAKALVGIRSEALPSNRGGLLPLSPRREKLFDSVGNILTALKQGNYQLTGPPVLRDALLPIWSFKKELTRHPCRIHGQGESSCRTREGELARVSDCLIKSLEGWLGYWEGIGR